MILLLPFLFVLLFFFFCTLCTACSPTRAALPHSGCNGFGASSKTLKRATPRSKKRSPSSFSLCPLLGTLAHLPLHFVCVCVCLRNFLSGGRAPDLPPADAARG